MNSYNQRNPYRREVIDAACEGLKAGGVYTEQMVTAFIPLLERVYDSGYNEAMRSSQTLPLYPPVLSPTYKMGCRVCGIGQNGEVMGYVCNRTDCPTRISCL